MLKLSTNKFTVCVQPINLMNPTQLIQIDPTQSLHIRLVLELSCADFEKFLNIKKSC